MTIIKLLLSNSFIFARWIHLFCTLFFNFSVMWDVEMLIGWLPVSNIYLGSGFTGNVTLTSSAQ